MSSDGSGLVTIQSLIDDEVIVAHKDGNYGSSYPRTAEFGDEGVPFLTAKLVSDGGRIDFENAPRLAFEKAHQLTYGFIQPSDVLLSHNATVGRVAVVPELDEPTLIGTSLTYFRVDKSRLLPRYLAAYFKGVPFQNQLKSVMSHSTRNQVPITAQRLLSVVVPRISEQLQIAETIGMLDDKIEQNRRTAGVLERLARAIFRAWFIDFLPVKAKAAGETSFPSMPQEVFDTLPTEFQDSELGPIPRGWEVKASTDVAKVAIGKTPPRKEPHWFSLDPADVRWVSIKDMGQAGAFISDTSEYLTEDAVEKCRVRRIPDRSVLFSFKLTLGRVTITDGEMTSNEAIAHFIPNEREVIGTEYLYCYLSNFDHARLGSTSSIATATNSKAVKAMPVIVAPDPIAEAFTETIRPSFDLLRQLGHESHKLAELRDYLLPKLLSGQVRVGGMNNNA